MNSFNVTELKENSYFTQEVFLDKSFLLLNSSLPVTKNLVQSLLEWEFRQVFSNGTIGVGGNSAVLDARPKSVPRSNSRKNIYQTTLEEIGQPDRTSDSNTITIIQAVYNQYLQYIDELYTSFATHRKLSFEDIYAEMIDLCNYIRENSKYVLRVQPTQSGQNKVFLVNHALRSTIIAVIIGIQLKFPDEKLVELAIACLLHEIGMIKLPPQIYITDKPLTPAEKNSIFTHPVISYNILKEYNFPLNICLAVLEHHEKENGTGYPRKLNSTQISLFAKIISIACSYEAITSPRHYKEAANSSAAMVELLKNSGKQYDEMIMKTLLYALSLFPIGTYVYLSDGRMAQVIDVNPEDPKNPIVQIYGKVDADGKAIVVKTSDGGIKITRALNQEELSGMHIS